MSAGFDRVGVSIYITSKGIRVLFCMGWRSAEDSERKYDIHAGGQAKYSESYSSVRRNGTRESCGCSFK